MARLIAGYNYDIFISYRQKDNKVGRQGAPGRVTTQSGVSYEATECRYDKKVQIETWFHNSL